MNAKTIAGLGSLALLCVLIPADGADVQRPAKRMPGPATEGTLLGFDKQGNPSLECPLKHTDVKAEITGFMARVTVTQEFQNTRPTRWRRSTYSRCRTMAAVDAWTCHVGDRI